MKRWLLVLTATLLLTLLLAAAAQAQPVRSHDALAPAAPPASRIAPEIPTRPYASYVYYSELSSVLKRIDARSRRVTMKQIGLSANGNPMWLVTVTAPWQSARVRQRNLTYRKLVLTDPTRAKKMLTATSGIRAPLYINCSIHGGETTGTDAGLALLRKLAFANDATTRRILKNAVVFINPCQNPDGRITDTRANGNGFDCNRDFITLTQPETQATVAQIRAFKPVAFLDLHGFVNPMLIEPCTIPHNPSLEYDLFIRWALPLAQTMKAELETQTGMTAQIPYLWGTAADKLDDINEGWDDYGPYYTGMIAQQMGSLGYTLETPYKTQDGVDAHYWTSWAMLKYVVRNRLAIMRDQAEGFRRGDKDVPDSATGRPWQGNMTDMLRPVPWGDPTFPYSDVVGDVDFPYAYIIPVDEGQQKDVLQAYRFVNHARRYGVEVHRAKAAFTVDGTVYGAGTFVVRTQQPLRALANNLLWDGEDVSATYGVGAMYDISAWSLPESWGFDCVNADDPFSASLAKVTAAVKKTGRVTGDGPVYWFDGTTNQSVKVVNDMLQRLYTVGMVVEESAPYTALTPGSFVVDTTDTPGATDYLRRTAAASGIDFTDVDVTMDEVAVLSRPTVAVNVDAQTVWVLKEVLGFANVTNVSAAPAVGITTTAYLNGSTSATLLPDVQTWLDGAGETRQRIYLGIGGGSAQAWATGLLPGVTVTRATSTRDNGLVMAQYDPDSIYTAGYPEDDYAFAYPPYWLAEASPSVNTDIAYQAGIAGPYFAGFWTTDSAGAVGNGAMVSGTYDGAAATDYGRVALMGIQPTYRAIEENTYVLVARAVFLSNATFPAAP